MNIRFAAGSVLLALSAAGHAQRVEVRFEPVEGPPCVARSLDRSNAQQAPVQRAVYSSRITEMRAVIVAGSGQPMENRLVAFCA